MTTSQTLAICAASAGTLGSILTAFSLNHTIATLKLARDALDVTLDDLANGERDIFVFSGFDALLAKAGKKDSTRLWGGVGLLALGFICQAFSTCLS